MRWWLALVLTSGGCTFGGTSGGLGPTGATPGTGDDADNATEPTGPGNATDGVNGSGSGSGASNATADSSGSPLDGTTADSAGEATGPGSDTTDTGATSTGGEPAEGLVQDGLLVRYYLDEADEGSPDGATVFDHGPNPPLDLILDTIAGEPEYFQAVDSNRGLEWAAEGLDGRPSQVLNGKVYDALANQTDATFEFVAAATTVHFQGSRFVHIGPPASSQSHLSIASEDLQQLELRWEFGNPLIRWDVDLSAGRTLYTVVIDITAMPPARLYVDGAEAPIAIGPMAVPSETFYLQPGDELALGNRPDGERSFAGRLYYAAVYDRALSSDEVKANASLLMASDDEP